MLQTLTRRLRRQTTTPAAFTAARQTTTLTTAPPPEVRPQNNDPAWWTLLTQHTTPAHGSAEGVELKLQTLRTSGRPEAPGERQKLAIELLDALFPQVDLVGALFHVAPVPGTGNLPVLALYPIGKRGQKHRRCHIMTQQCALNHPVGKVEFTTVPRLMGEVANLTQAFTGKEQKGLGQHGLRVNWDSDLNGELPPEVLGVATSFGLLEGEDGGGAEGGGTLTIGGERVEVPAGTTAVLVGPAAWQAELDDPALLLVVPVQGKKRYYLHAGLGRLNHFTMVGGSK